MNRGSALKWIEQLETTKHGYDVGQLACVAPASFDENDNPSNETQIIMCPMGILATFLDPDGWELGPDGVSMLFHGEQFQLPQKFRKRCKMKTDGYDPLSEINGGVNFPKNPRSLVDVMGEFKSHAGFAEFVRENYAAI